MSPNCAATWGPDQTDGSCKAKNTAGATVIGQLWVPNCKLPLCYSSKPTRWKPACPGTYTALSQESCLRLQRSFPWGGTRQPSFVFLQPVSRALQAHPTRGAPCSGARPGKRAHPPLSRVTAGFHGTPVGAQWEGHTMESCLPSW